MFTDRVTYSSDNHEFRGLVAYDDSHSQPRPGVLVVHDWSGCNDFAQENALAIAKLGYFAFAVDMYGNGETLDKIEEKQRLMKPLLENRQELRKRIQAALKKLLTFPQVDRNAIGGFGFCFGGLCMLDLARSGAPIQAVASFHGMLHAPADIPNSTINAKVLVLHGFDDPMVPPEQLVGFANEMTQQKVDWQLQIFGNTTHAFMNPRANNPAIGFLYQDTSAKRAWHSLENFLSETFKK